MKRLMIAAMIVVLSLTMYSCAGKGACCERGIGKAPQDDDKK